MGVVLELSRARDLIPAEFTVLLKVPQHLPLGLDVRNRQKKLVVEKVRASPVDSPHAIVNPERCDEVQWQLGANQFLEFFDSLWRSRAPQRSQRRTRVFLQHFVDQFPTGSNATHDAPSTCSSRPRNPPRA